MFLLFWLILLISGTRKQSRNRPAFRLPLSRAVKARREPNGSNVFSISYGRRTTKSVSETVSGTVSERSRRQFGARIFRDAKTARVLLSRYIGTGKLREFWRPEISAQFSR